MTRTRRNLTRSAAPVRGAASCDATPWLLAAAMCALAAAMCGCGRSPIGVRVDGSSTVYLISEAVAEEFRDAAGEVRVTVGSSGTGGGLKKFAAGEIDVCGASRRIKPTEADACDQAGIERLELSVAYDGIAIVVNPKNDWCRSLSVEQLAMIWRPDDPARLWSDIDPDWPEHEIVLYGPGTDSGTFDYFTAEVVGEEKSCRSDYTASEDDNVLVTGVSEDLYALGYFGFAYFLENREVLRLLPVRAGDGPAIAPTHETIRSNEYRPLSRPLFLYVRKSTLLRPEGKRFIDFYLENAGRLAEEVGYVAPPEAVLREDQRSVEEVVSAAPAETEAT